MYCVIKHEGYLFVCLFICLFVCLIHVIFKPSSLLLSSKLKTLVSNDTYYACIAVSVSGYSTLYSTKCLKKLMSWPSDLHVHQTRSLGVVSSRVRVPIPVMTLLLLSKALKWGGSVFCSTVPARLQVDDTHTYILMNCEGGDPVSTSGQSGFDVAICINLDFFLLALTFTTV